MLRHPVQHPRRRTHRVSRIKLHPRRRSAHRHRAIPTQHRIAFLGHRQRPSKRFEVLRRIVVTRPRQAYVLVNHGTFLLPELLLQHTLQRRKSHPHHAQPRADRQRILRHLVLTNVRQRRHRNRAHLHPRRRTPRLDQVRVIQTRATRRQQPQVPLHRVLIQRDQQIDPLIRIRYPVHARSYRQKRMPTANDRLIRVIRIQMQPATAEYLRKNITRRRHTLPRRAPDPDTERLPHGHLRNTGPRRSAPRHHRNI